MIDIKELLLKHGANDGIIGDPDTFVMHVNQLQSLLDEYLALSSSEPVAKVIHYTTELDGKEVIIPKAQLMFTAIDLPVDTPLYLANPLNQQLLTERNECVEAMQRLKSAFHINMLRAFPNKTHQEISDEIDKALSTTDSIKKLINQIEFRGFYD